MTRLIIDTDPGVDDAFAITLAALDPGAELLAVTTVFGNVALPATTANARRVLALCEREDVPVAAGADRPLVHPQPHRAHHAHGSDGLSGRSAALPNSTRAARTAGAVDLMARLLDEADEPVTIVPIGPLTNIALLLASYPELATKIERLVVMGGAVHGGNSTAAAEFNIWSDPEAARRVLVGESVPCVLVPLDLTYRCAVGTGWLDTLRGSGPRGAALCALVPDYLEHYRAALGWDGIVLHDAVAVAEALRPGILDGVSYPLDVDCSFGPSRGATIIDRRRGGPHPAGTAQTRAVDIAMDTDLDGLREFLLAGLCGG
ncbi:pyrimidine-specific ribonucleoside hydrolase [Haloechinothrix alba]|uniref:Pyrimidine-specific ribonucleoside hydrolase n=1 Tax=Haloechinothrix alba TaxID=664784 RepID=A0A238VL39_9PSEU|nr:nucleoside hydrolase [Haloechinothrix alba]SNR35100.1 pyrimidine-specific ribonucleoside hydrolase [Haloechinothrix alba]